MASQQQPRPWFRLASIRPFGQPPPPGPPAPAPALAPAPATAPAPAPAPALQPQFPVSQPIRPPIAPSQPLETTPVPPSPPSTSINTALASPATPPRAAPSPTKPTTTSPRSTIAAPSSPAGTVPRTRTAVPSPTPRATPPRTPAIVPPQPSADTAQKLLTIVPPVANGPRSPTVATSLSPSSPIVKASSPLLSPARKASPSTSTVAPLQSSSLLQTSPKVTATTPSKPKSPSLPSPKTVAAPPASPKPSPKIFKSFEYNPPHESPKRRPISHPPSPLQLPPAQMKVESAEAKSPPEAEQKTILVQELTEKAKLSTPLSGNISQNGNRDFFKDKGHNKKHSESEEYGMRVVTLAGENKGAIMELSPSKQKYGFNGRPHSLQKEETDKSESDEEGISKMRERTHKANGMRSLPMTAFMNSNVQGVNNSILHNSSCTHHDPGVHLSFSRKANGSHGTHIKNHTT